MNAFLKKIDLYYSQKLELFGNTALGVDWKNSESQQIRFDQLVQIITQDHFSILDYGCGYAALYSYLVQGRKQFSYTGYDISQQMIAAAIGDTAKAENVFFTNTESLLSACDYTIASGIFNVKLDIATNEWEQYIFDTLYKMNALSIKGFSFNMLSSDCDVAYMKDYLYYANNAKIMGMCKSICKGKIKLMKGYGLYEFTVLVNKI